MQSTAAPYHLAVVVERRTVHIFTHPSSSTPLTTSASSLASINADSSSTTTTPPTSAPLTTIRLPTSTSASALAAQRKQVSLTASLSQAQHNDRHNQQADSRKKKYNKPTALHASTLVDELDGGEMVLAVRFVSDDELLVVRGDRERAAFERVKYGGGGGSGEEVVLEARLDESAEAQREEGLPRKKVRSTDTHAHSVTAGMRTESERERYLPLAVSSNSSEIRSHTPHIPSLHTEHHLFTNVLVSLLLGCSVRTT